MPEGCITTVGNMPAGLQRLFKLNKVAWDWQLYTYTLNVPVCIFSTFSAPGAHISLGRQS